MVKTKISALIDGRLVVRGYDIAELIATASFADCVHLLLSGELPEAGARRVIEAILVSCIDHGVNAPSIHVARASASCGIPISTAVAAGIASIGKHHGGAGEECARLLQEAASGSGTPREQAARIVGGAIDAGKNLPGFGHRDYKETDPRTAALFEVARNNAHYSDHCRLAEMIVEELERRKGWRLVLNIDGAHAAILSDLGYHWSRVQSFFLIGRSVGLCAHVHEEVEGGRPLGYLGSSRVEVGYEGPEGRRIEPAETEA
ncbi:MAG TPA: citryl-CoA lyase [Spirochaetia bacterium]|nr:citryl-CoA lyase [Spirochaetia bacterium]